MKYIVSLTALGLLTAGLYFGYSYFNEHYIILSDEDVNNLIQNIAVLRQQAYHIGLTACNKTL